MVKFTFGLKLWVYSLNINNNFLITARYLKKRYKINVKYVQNFHFSKNLKIRFVILRPGLFTFKQIYLASSCYDLDPW